MKRFVGAAPMTFDPLAALSRDETVQAVPRELDEASLALRVTPVPRPFS